MLATDRVDTPDQPRTCNTPDQPQTRKSWCGCHNKLPRGYSIGRENGPQVGFSFGSRGATRCTHVSTNFSLILCVMHRVLFVRSRKFQRSVRTHCRTNTVYTTSDAHGAKHDAHDTASQQRYMPCPVLYSRCCSRAPCHKGPVEWYTPGVLRWRSRGHRSDPTEQPPRLRTPTQAGGIINPHPRKRTQGLATKHTSIDCVATTSMCTSLREMTRSAELAAKLTRWPSCPSSPT